MTMYLLAWVTVPARLSSHLAKGHQETPKCIVCVTDVFPSLICNTSSLAPPPPSPLWWSAPFLPGCWSLETRSLKCPNGNYSSQLNGTLLFLLPEYFSPWRTVSQVLKSKMRPREVAFTPGFLGLLCVLPVGYVAPFKGLKLRYIIHPGGLSLWLSW